MDIWKVIMLMYTAFNNLEKNKQQEIINAAMKEFVQRGFEKASTNDIVKRAQISKGSLFNYFNSKKNLYVYLIDYSVQILDEIFDYINLAETDIFRRIEDIGWKKLRIQEQYPQVFDFLASTQQEESYEVRDLIIEKIAPIYEKSSARMYEEIDYTKFREGIDKDKAIQILNWTMFGFGEQGVKQLQSFENIHAFGEQYFEEWRQYAEILKMAFYK